MLYVIMYRSTLSCTVEDIERYLDDVEFPNLTEEQDKMMKEGIDEEEVRETISPLATGKSSGPDGLTGIYTIYRHCSAVFI